MDQRLTTLIKGILLSELLVIGVLLGVGLLYPVVGVQVGVVAMVGALFLLPVLVYRLLKYRITAEQSPWLLFSLCALVLSSVATWLGTQAGPLGFFGLQFEVGTPVSVVIFVIHLWAAMHIGMYAQPARNLLLHVAGIVSVLTAFVQTVSGSDQSAAALYIAVSVYSFYCAYQIDYPGKEGWVWGSFIASLLALAVLTPTVLVVVLLIIFGGHLVWRALQTKRKLFALYLPFAALVVAISLAVLSGSYAQLHSGVPLQYAPLVVVGEIFSEHNFLASMHGKGGMYAPEVWYTHAPESLYQDTKSFDDPVVIGSYAFTYIATGGYVALLAWVFFLAVSLWYLRGLYGSKRDDDHVIPLLYVGGGVAVIFCFSPSESLLLIAALMIGLYGVSAQNSLPQERSGKRLSVIVTVLMVLIALLTLKHVSSIAIAAHYHELARMAAPEGRTGTAGWALSNARETRDHMVIMRTQALFDLSMIRSQLANGEPLDPARMDALLALATSVTERDPVDYEGWLILGNVYFLLSQLGVEGAADKAEESYRSAKERAPGQFDIMYMEAQLTTHMGRYDDARQYLDRLQQVDPDEAEYAEILEYIEEKSAG